MKIKLKDKKGFTSVDLTLAMIVVIIFAVIMTSISYNMYLSSTEAKRTAVAVNYAVDIFEHIGELDYSDVNSISGELFEIESFNNFELNNITGNNGTETITGTIGTYNIELKIDDYNGQDVIKIINLKITYPVSRKNTEKVEMSRLKIRTS